MMNPEIILKVEDLNVTFDDINILKSVNFNVFRSEILAIVGVSGSGKTTLLMTLLGLIKPTGGDVFFAHKTKKGITYKSVFDYLDYFRAHVGYSTQETSFYNQLTVRENLEFFGSLYSLTKKEIKERAIILLDLFELKEYKDRLAKNLSGGMRKRLDLAISLIHNPLILILDEPTSELDPMLRKEMWYFIKKINQKGKTIILTTHFINDMESLADRLAVLSEKRISMIGTPNEIREHLGLLDQIILETLPGNYDMLLEFFYKNKKIGLKNHRITSDNLILFVENSHDSLLQIIKILEELNEKIINLQIRKPPLDEIFEILS